MIIAYLCLTLNFSTRINYDFTYGMFHEEMVADCVKNGQYDVSTMGAMKNIDLMAQKAEEYDSHPTTFDKTYS